MFIENNFFNFAKKETTQDTFVAWLISNFNSANKSSTEYIASENFLKYLFYNSRHIKLNLTNYMIQVEMQKNINSNIFDILITLTNKTNKKDLYFIIFEDKLYSSNTSKDDKRLQLDRYQESLQKSNNITDNSKILLVYYKMIISECEKNKIIVKNNDIVIIDKNIMLKILSNLKNDNIIINSYKEWLENINNIYEKYKENCVYDFQDKNIFNLLKSDNTLPNKKIVKRTIFYSLFDKIYIKYKNHNKDLNFEVLSYNGKLDYLEILIHKDFNEHISIIVTSEGTIDIWHEFKYKNNEKIDLNLRNTIRNNIASEYKNFFKDTFKQGGKLRTDGTKNKNDYFELYIGSIKNDNRTFYSIINFELSEILDLMIQNKNKLLKLYEETTQK